MSAIDTACRPGFTMRIGIALALCLAAVAIASAGPSVFPTGVTRYEPSQAYNCYVLFSAPDQKTYLIDMDGHVVHRWERDGFPAKMLDPALTGGVKGEVGLQLSTVPAGSKAGGIGLVPGHAGIFRDLTFGYMDWAGKTVWQWGTQAPGGAALQHHDWQLLPNGDTMLLVNKVGRLKGFGSRLMLDDVIYEVTRAGRIVWTWRASEHLHEFGFTAAELKLLRRTAKPDYLHFNDMEVLGPNHWAASGDGRFAPGNILISSRNANFIGSISRKTGQIVWRAGPNFASGDRAEEIPQTRHKVPYKLDRFSGQHDAHMIPEGLPGAGNILIFDNEGEGGYPSAAMPLIAGSRVLEFNPVTREVVWQYTGSKATFFSPFISSVQRLPNGNTLIDEGIWGRFFQVTPKGKIVWEYMSPFVGTGSGAGFPVRWVYRIQAVPYGWVPKGVPHSEVAVQPPAEGEFHIKTRKK
jgi:hypothetical protein